MKVFVTGGTGFVGRHLTRAFAEAGHDVAVLTRSLRKGAGHADGLKFVEGDSTEAGPWQEQLKRHDVVINLAGAPIFKRWSGSYKRTILESRIRTTSNIVDALKETGGPRALLSASAVGYYGFHGDEVLTEDAPAGADFLAGVASEWEETARRATEHGCRVVLCRFGIVLGGDGGALAQMVDRFKRSLVTVIGSGRQWFSWIHIQDLVRIFQYLSERDDVEGPVNCVSPGPVRNRELTEAIAERMGKRVSRISVPGFVLRMALGEFGDVLLKGQRVSPKVLEDLGFEFEFGDLKAALADLLGEKP